MKQINNILLIMLIVLSTFIITISSTCTAVNGLQQYTQLDGSTCDFTCPSNAYKNNNGFVCT